MQKTAMPQFGKSNRDNITRSTFVSKRPLGNTTSRLSTSHSVSLTSRPSNPVSLTSTPSHSASLARGSSKLSTVSPDHHTEHTIKDDVSASRQRALSKKKLIRIAIIVPSAIALIFAICTIYLLATRNSNSTKPIKTATVSLSELEEAVPGFYPENIQNSNGIYSFTIDDYTENGDQALSLKLVDQNTAELFVNWPLATAQYELSLSRNDQETFTFSFEKPVADIALFSPSGKSRNQTFVFIMADGTVEYMPIRSVLQNRAPGSFGQLGSYENIVKFYHANVKTSAQPSNTQSNDAGAESSDASSDNAAIQSSDNFSTLLIQNAAGEIFDLKNDFSIL